MTQGGMGCAGIGTGAGTGSAISASVLTVGVLGDGMPAGAGLVVVFTLIGDGVSGGVGEASSISSFGLIMDAEVAHCLSPGVARSSWPRASAGLVGDFTGGTALAEPGVFRIGGSSSSMASSWVFHWLAMAR